MNTILVIITAAIFENSYAFLDCYLLELLGDKN
jgi:hypothetical protein